MMLPLGIIPGPKKPKYLMSFLKPIIEEINDLSSKGFTVKKNGAIVHQSKVFLLGITGDIPGISDLINHRHTSEYGCRYCHAFGEASEVSPHGKYFRYPGDLRTKEEIVYGSAVSFILLFK